MGGELKGSGGHGTREKLEKQTKFEFEKLKGRGTLGDLSIDKMLKTM